MLPTVLLLNKKKELQPFQILYMHALCTVDLIHFLPVYLLEKHKSENLQTLHKLEILPKASVYAWPLQKSQQMKYSAQ